MRGASLACVRPLGPTNFQLKPEDRHKIRFGNTALPELYTGSHLYFIRLLIDCGCYVAVRAEGAS